MRTKAEVVAYVKTLMTQKKLTKSGLGEALGATGGAQSKVQRANGFLSDKSQKINLPDLMIVAQFLGVDPKDIILKGSSEQALNKDMPHYNINPNHLVPLMTKADKESEEKILNEWLVYPYDKSAHKKIVAIPMPDTRMEPEITKGEILFVDSRLYSFTLDGAIILASYQNDFIVGRFNRLINGQIEISFVAEEAETLSYSTDNEHLEILGVVVCRFTKF